VPNKVTREFRETVRRLLVDNTENVGAWLAAVADGGKGVKPDPGKALDLLVKLAEFAAPKLGRIEHAGPDGGPVQLQGVPWLDGLSDEQLRVLASIRLPTDGDDAVG